MSHSPLTNSGLTHVILNEAERSEESPTCSIARGRFRDFSLLSSLKMTWLRKSCNFQLRLVATVLIGVVTLLIGLLWLGEQTPSWAAPAQNPNLQTVPPRPPDDNPTPEPPDPVPSVPGPAPSAEPQASTPKEDKDDSNQENDPPPVQPTEEIDNENQDEPQLTQPPEQPDNKEQDQALPSQTPELGSDQDQAQILEDITPTPSAQVDLRLSETVNNTLPNIAEAITSTSPSTSGFASAVALSDEAGSLNWLYTLGLGLILVLSGIFLVNRGEGQKGL